MKINIPEYFKKHKTLIIIAVIGIISVSYLLFSDYGLIQLISLKSKKNELIEKIILERKDIDSLKTLIKELETNKETLEKIAREKYGMKKPNETIIILQTQKEKPK